MLAIRAALAILNFMFISLLFFFAAGLERDKRNAGSFIGFAVMAAILIADTAYILISP